MSISLVCDAGTDAVDIPPNTTIRPRLEDIDNICDLADACNLLRAPGYTIWHVAYKWIATDTMLVSGDCEDVTVRIFESRKRITKSCDDDTAGIIDAIIGLGKKRPRVTHEEPLKKRKADVVGEDDGIGEDCDSSEDGHNDDGGDSVHSDCSSSCGERSTEVVCPPGGGDSILECMVHGEPPAARLEDLKKVSKAVPHHGRCLYPFHPLPQFPEDNQDSTYVFCYTMQISCAQSRCTITDSQTSYCIITHQELA